MEKVNKNNVEPIEDPCGLMRELFYHSDNISIAHVQVSGRAKRHKHQKTEEIYYVEKGEGKLVVDDEVLTLKEGDLFPVPKDSWHYLEKMEDKQFEVLVICHPRFNPEDFITEEKE